MHERSVSRVKRGAAVGCAPSAASPNDEVLAAGVVSRDLAAFGLLFDRYARPVYAMAAHLLGPSEAEEVVQEVFLILWQRADRYDPMRGPFRPWFMAVARHHALRELRRRGPERQMAASWEVEQVLAGAADRRADVEEATWRREEDEAVLHALAELPPEQRHALVLAYFGGLSQSAIAQRLGWPLGTVKKRTRLGLQKLRAALAGYAPSRTDSPGRPTGPVASAATSASTPTHATTEHADDGL